MCLSFTEKYFQLSNVVYSRAVPRANRWKGSKTSRRVTPSNVTCSTNSTGLPTLVVFEAIHNTPPSQEQPIGGLIPHTNALNSWCFCCFPRRVSCRVLAWNGSGRLSTTVTDLREGSGSENDVVIMNDHSLLFCFLYLPCLRWYSRRKLPERQSSGSVRDVPGPVSNR